MIVLTGLIWLFLWPVFLLGWLVEKFGDWIGGVLFQATKDV